MFHAGVFALAMHNTHHTAIPQISQRSLAGRVVAVIDHGTARNGETPQAEPLCNREMPEDAIRLN